MILNKITSPVSKTILKTKEAIVFRNLYSKNFENGDMVIDGVYKHNKIDKWNILVDETLYDNCARKPTPLGVG